jgi:hypothetical protein
MFKRIATFTLICLVLSLWPARATTPGRGDDGGRYVAGFSGHAVVLVAHTRVRVQARAPHRPATGLSAGMVLVRVVVPPVWAATRSIQTVPSHRIATHLSL